MTEERPQPFPEVVMVFVTSRRSTRLALGFGLTLLLLLMSVMVAKLSAAASVTAMEPDHTGPPSGLDAFGSGR